MTTRAGQGGFQDWAALRNHLIERYGSTPHPATEQEIIDAYELHPDAVTKAALDLIGAPDVTSPWGVLKARAAKIAAPPSNPTHDSSITREKRIARAEQWIRAAGIHIDRESEILDELFGSESSLLRPYAQVDLQRTGPNDEQGRPTWQLSDPRGDTALTNRILTLWREHRPTGERLEQEAEDRAATYKQHQANLQAALHQAHAELQAAATPATPDDDLPL